MQKILAILYFLTDTCAMTHRINWNDLQYIMAVAENGSLSAAARELGVNHATVLRRITAFENTHQIQLFERHPTGYRLNPQSHYMLSVLEGMRENVAGLERSISGLGYPQEGNIRITSTDTLSQHFLIPHISDLSTLHPRLNIELLSTNHRLDLAQMDAEITIRPTLALPDDLVGEKVSRMLFKPYATPAYWESNPSDRIADHTWIAVSEPLTFSPVGRWQEEHNAGAGVFHSDSFLTMQQFVQNHVGIGILPCFVADQSDLLCGDKRFDFVLATDIWAATHRDLAESPWISELIGYFFEIFKQHEARFLGERG